MQGACVQVRRNQHLILIAPHFLGKLNADFVAKLRRYLTCFKALISVIGDVTACFSEAFLHGAHLLKGSIGVAVYTRYIATALRFASSPA